MPGSSVVISIVVAIVGYILNRRQESRQDVMLNTIITMLSNPNQRFCPRYNKRGHITGVEKVKQRDVLYMRPDGRPG